MLTVNDLTTSVRHYRLHYSCFYRKNLVFRFVWYSETHFIGFQFKLILRLKKILSLFCKSTRCNKCDVFILVEIAKFERIFDIFCNILMICLEMRLIDGARLKVQASLSLSWCVYLFHLFGSLFICRELPRFNFFVVSLVLLFLY